MNGNTAFIDRDGNIVRRFETYVGPFHDGLARIGQPSGSAFITIDGEIAFESSVEISLGFSDGVAVGVLGDKRAAIDMQGNILFETDLPLPIEFHEGLAAVYRTDWPGIPCGYIDRTGQVSIPFEFDEARPFQNGVAAVRVGDRWGIIDRTGDYLVEPTYMNGPSFAESDVAPVNFDGKWGYIDLQGNIVIEPTFDKARSFSDGCAPFSLDGAWGFIDLGGRVLVPPMFDDLWPYVHGFCRYAKLGANGTLQYGYLDRNHNAVTEAMFHEARDFREGLAEVITLESGVPRSGFIDETGAVVVPLQYNRAWPFENGLALVSTDEWTGYINIDGDVVYKKRHDDEQ
ncbi:MAG: WG repeat-containing protein [Phycisphaerales bacterium]